MPEAAGAGIAAVRAAQRDDAGAGSPGGLVPTPPAGPRPGARGQNPRAKRLRGEGGATAPVRSQPARSGRKRAAKAKPKKGKGSLATSQEEGGCAAEDDEQERGRIKDACMRGLSLGQLLDFFEEECGNVLLEDSRDLQWQRPICQTTKLAKKCIQKNQSRRVEISEGKAHELVPNMYAVDELAVSPRCAADCVSMAELLNPDGLLIRMFVSHSWAEHFGEFVQGVYRFVLTLMVENNAGLTSSEIHSRAREMALYIWAFSNNRWKVKAEGSKRLESSLFYKVLEAETTWHVMLSIDQNCSAFQRAWCGIEYFFASELEALIVLNTRFGPLEQVPLESKAETFWMIEVMELLQELDASLAQASRRSDLDQIQARIQAIEGEGSVGSATLNSLLKSSVADSTLHSLVKTGNVEAVKQALEASADPDAYDRHYVRPLSYAAALHGVDCDLVQLLKSRGANALALEGALHVSRMFDSDEGIRNKAIAEVQQLPGDVTDFHANTILTAERENAERAVCKQAYALVDPEEQVRLEAIQAISSIGDVAAPALATRLGDPSLALRDKAEKILDGLEDVSSAAVNLARLLHNESSDVRRRAAGWLGECGEEASYYVCDLASLLGDEDAEVSMEAKQALVSLGEVAAEAAHLLVQFLKHQAAQTRAGAAEVLLGLDQESFAVESLDFSSLLMDVEKSVRDLAVSAFDSSSIKCSKALSAAVERLGCSEARAEARRAVESLGKLAAEAAPEISKLLTGDAEQRVLAADLLICIEWWESSRASKVAKTLDLHTLLVDEDEGVRGVATTALEVLGDAAGEVASKVVSLLASPEAALRERGKEVLESYAPLAAGAAPALIKLLKHESCEVRQCAVAQLAHLGAHAAKAAAAMASLLADPEEEVRAEVVKAFVCLDSHGEEAVPKLAKLLKHEEATVRAKAAEVLRQLGDEEGEPGAPYSKQIAKALGEDASDEEVQEQPEQQEEEEAGGDENDEEDEEEKEEEEEDDEEEEDEDDKEEEDEDDAEDDIGEDDDEEKAEDIVDGGSSGATTGGEPLQQKDDSGDVDEKVESGTGGDTAANDSVATTAAVSTTKTKKKKKTTKKADEAGKKGKKEQKSTQQEASQT